MFVLNILRYLTFYNLCNYNLCYVNEKRHLKRTLLSSYGNLYISNVIVKFICIIYDSFAIDMFF